MIAGPLFGGGKRDSDISRADELIGEKRYDEAILLLTESVKKNPENFASAEKRIQQIVKIRNEYNTVADELLDTVVDDPGNAEKILNLTRRLESLESASNPQVRAFLDRTLELALFRFNENRLQEILVRGRELIDQGAWQEALTVYASGMDIYRDDFFTGGYGELIENRVTQGIGDIETVVESFPALVVPLNGAAEEMAQAGRQDAPAAQFESIFNRINPSLDRLISLYGYLYTTVDYFNVQLDQLQQEDSTLGDRSFLSFAIRLIYGRSVQRGPEDEPQTVTVREGMMGVLEGYWNSLMSGMENSAAEPANRYYTAALNQARNWEYNASGAAFRRAETYLSLPFAMIDKWRAFRENAGFPMMSFYEQSVPAEKGADFLRYESLGHAVTYLLEGTGIGARYEEGLGGGGTDTVELWRNGGLETAEALQREEQAMDNAFAAIEGIDALLGEVDTGTAELGVYQDSLPPENQGQDVLSYLDAARSFIQDLRSRIAEEENDSAVRYFTIANSELEGRVVGRRAELDEGSRYIQGIPRDDGSDTVLYYPAEGLAVLTRMESELEADNRTAEALLARYAEEPPESLSTGNLAVFYTGAEAMAEELNSLGLRGRALAAEARTRIAQADTYRIDGDRLFLEAQNALSQ
ncbi:MAG: hypothetical protein LBQ55_07010, partial [Treponema sp.]|nr:hypothetical protein [Treponema sp.]